MRFLLCLEHCYVAKLDSSAQYADTTGEHNILTPSSSLIFRKRLSSHEVLSTLFNLKFTSTYRCTVPTATWLKSAIFASLPQPSIYLHYSKKI